MDLTGKSIIELLPVPLPSNLLAPLKALGKALASPGLARDHDLSRDLRTYLANNYEIEDFELSADPPSVVISLRRGEDVRRIESDDLAFVTYAANKVPREQTRERLRAESKSDGGLQ